MKQKLLLAILIGACFLLQSAVFPHFALAGIVPNILIAMIVSMSLLKGSLYGLWIGFFSGVLIDLFFGDFLGMYALMYMYIGTLCGLFQRWFYPDDMKLPLFLIGASDLFCSLICFGVFSLSRGGYDFLFFFYHIILPELVYTLVTGVFIYLILLRIVPNSGLSRKRSHSH